MKKSTWAVLSVLVFVLASSCKKEIEQPTPDPTPVSSDPRDVYSGNYHFTRIHTNWTMMSQTTTVDTFYYDGSIFPDPGSTDKIVIATGPYSGDTLKVVPDANGHFWVNSYPDSEGNITTTGVVDMSYTASRSPSHDFHRDVHGERY